MGPSLLISAERGARGINTTPLGMTHLHRGLSIKRAVAATDRADLRGVSQHRLSMKTRCDKENRGLVCRTLLMYIVDADSSHGVPRRFQIHAYLERLAQVWSVGKDSRDRV